MIDGMACAIYDDSDQDFDLLTSYKLVVAIDLGTALVVDMDIMRDHRGSQLEKRNRN